MGQMLQTVLSDKNWELSIVFRDMEVLCDLQEQIQWILEVGRTDYIRIKKKFIRK